MQHLLVLAGTGEARQLVNLLAADNRFKITASLKGVTSAPLPLGVPTRRGGFGGVDGLIDFLRRQEVDLMIDMTHPYASQMSAHAAIVAEKISLPTIAFHRPSWVANETDKWVEFVSWEAMASAVPAGANLFLAGGSGGLDAFLARSDIGLLMRGLNLQKYKKKLININILEELPNKSVEYEMRLLRDYSITHVCCKNSGGAFSQAKLMAARKLGLPVWMLARPSRPQNTRFYQVVDDVNLIMQALAS